MESEIIVTPVTCSLDILLLWYDSFHTEKRDFIYFDIKRKTQPVGLIKFETQVAIRNELYNEE